MTNLFSKNHDFFIENYLNRFELDKNEVFTDRLLFGKTKSHYIFPFYLSIKVTLFYCYYLGNIILGLSIYDARNSIYWHHESSEIHKKLWIYHFKQ